jgi:hypothetical protein
MSGTPLLSSLVLLPLAASFFEPAAEQLFSEV